MLSSPKNLLVLLIWTNYTAMIDGDVPGERIVFFSLPEQLKYG